MRTYRSNSPDTLTLAWRTQPKVATPTGARA